MQKEISGLFLRHKVLIKLLVTKFLKLKNYSKYQKLLKLRKVTRIFKFIFFNSQFSDFFQLIFNQTLKET